MPTFGSALWGGGGNNGGLPTVGVPLSSLVMPAYRIAGVTKWLGVGPSEDMYAEAIPELNRFIGSLNTSRLNIFTVRVDTKDLTGAKAYTIGPGGDFDMPRPQKIQNGVIVLSGGVRVEPPIHQMDDAEWARVSLQDIPDTIPAAFYYDGSYNENGHGLIYLWGQGGAGLQVDWYTWQSLPKFESKDDTVYLPDGYEDAIVYNLAVRLAALNPLNNSLPEEARRQARRALAAIRSLNAPTPNMSSDYSSGRSTRFDWRSGTVR